MAYKILSTGKIVSTLPAELAPVKPKSNLNNQLKISSGKIIDTPENPIYQAEIANKVWNRCIFYRSGSSIVKLVNPNNNKEKIYIIWLPSSTSLDPVKIIFEGDVENNFIVQLDDKQPFTVRRINPRLLDVYAINTEADLALGVLKVSVGKDSSDNFTIKALDDIGNVIAYYQSVKLDEALKSEIIKLIPTHNLSGQFAQDFIKQIDAAGYSILDLPKYIPESNGVGSYSTDRLSIAIANKIQIWTDDISASPFVYERRISLNKATEIIMSNNDIDLDANIPDPPDNPWRQVYKLDAWQFRLTADSMVGIAPESLAFIKITWIDNGYSVEVDGLPTNTQWEFNPIPATLGESPSKLLVNNVKMNPQHFTLSEDAIGIEITNSKIKGSRRFYKPIATNNQWIKNKIDRFGVPTYKYSDPNSDNELWIIQENELFLNLYFKGKGDWIIKSPGFAAQTILINKLYLLTVRFNGYIEIWDPNNSLNNPATIKEKFIDFKIINSEYFKIPNNWDLLKYDSDENSSSIYLSAGEILFYDNYVLINFNEKIYSKYFIAKVTCQDNTLRVRNNHAIAADDNKIYCKNPVLIEIWLDRISSGEADIVLSIPPTTRDDSFESKWKAYLQKIFLK